MIRPCCSLWNFPLIPCKRLWPISLGYVWTGLGRVVTRVFSNCRALVSYWTAQPVSRLLSRTVYGRCSEWWGRNCCTLRQSRRTATAAENCKPGVELMTNSVNPWKLCRTSNLSALYVIYSLATSSLNIVFSSFENLTILKLNHNKKHCYMCFIN